MTDAAEKKAREIVQANYERPNNSRLIAAIAAALREAQLSGLPLVLPKRTAEHISGCRTEIGGACNCGGPPLPPAAETPERGKEQAVIEAAKAWTRTDLFNGSKCVQLAKAVAALLAAEAERKK